MSVIIEDYKRVTKNTLRGFVRAKFPSGVIIAEIGIHAGPDGKAWASPPSRPMLDRDGAAVRTPDGKLHWQPLITFTSGKVRNAWSRQVVDALVNQYPDALDAAS
jgi:hypothetical protein